MSFRRVLVRGIALAVPLVVVATALPVVQTSAAPRVRNWTVDADRPQKAPGEFGLVGVSVPSGVAPENVRVRTSHDGRTWERWTPVEFEAEVGPDLDSHESGSRTSMPVWTGKRRFVDVRVGRHRRSGAKVHLIDPGADPQLPAATAHASPTKPGIISRAGWGADESIRKGKPEYAEPLKMAVVHHTATADSYSREQSDDIVRGIYAYHVRTNGWDDIGYNFLVDRHGQIFEGRAGGTNRTVVGAHSLGFNRHSTGISIIGNFANTKPPAAAMNSLKRILAWRLDQGFVDPEGSLTYVSNGSNKWPEGAKVSLKTISAHRDVGQTACPGNPLYSSLGWLRDQAAKDGLPKLYDAKVSRPIVTPNADGVSDALKLTGRFSSAASWKVSVVDAAGKSLHSLSGFGTTLSVNWYGKNSAGAAVPHGTYRFKVSASNSVGTVRTSYVPFQVWRYPNGTFFYTKSKVTYILEKNLLRHPSNWQARATRYSSAELVAVPDELTTAYRKSTHLGFRDGSVVDVEGNLYVISDGTKRPTTRTSLTRLGYDPTSIIETSEAALLPHRLGEDFAHQQGYPNGATLKSSAGQQAWVKGGIAQRFFSRNTRTSWQIRDVDLAGPADNKISEGVSAAPIGFRDGTLARLANQTTVYFISDGLRRPFVTPGVFSKMGFKTTNVRTVTPDELALHREGKPL